VLHEPEADERVHEEPVAERHGQHEVQQPAPAAAVEHTPVQRDGGQTVHGEVGELECVGAPIAKQAHEQGGNVHDWKPQTDNARPQDAAKRRVRQPLRGALPSPEERLSIDVFGRPGKFVVPGVAW